MADDPNNPGYDDPEYKKQVVRLVEDNEKKLGRPSHQWKEHEIVSFQDRKDVKELKKAFGILK